jgi:hypothetical protein
MKLPLNGTANHAEDVIFDPDSRITNRRISKGGLASLSPFYKKIEYLPSTFDIRYSLLESFLFDQIGRSAASGRSEIKIPTMPFQV